MGSESLIVFANRNLLDFGGENAFVGMFIPFAVLIWILDIELSKRGSGRWTYIQYQE